MRVLRFIVDGQIVKQDPACDFSNLVPGTEGYLRAEFSFSPEWAGFAKAAAFWSAMGKEYPARLLEDGKSCVIPVEALLRQVFKVGVVGRSGDKTIRTNKVTVRQNGGEV